MVRRGKPAPDLLLHIADSFKFGPKRCAVIEDTPTGVKAAVNAGMDVYGYAADHSAEELKSAGAITFSDMLQLPELIGI